MAMFFLIQSWTRRFSVFIILFFCSLSVLQAQSIESLQQFCASSIQELASEKKFESARHLFFTATDFDDLVTFLKSQPAPNLTGLKSLVRGNGNKRAKKGINRNLEKTEKYWKRIQERIKKRNLEVSLDELRWLKMDNDPSGVRYFRVKIRVRVKRGKRSSVRSHKIQMIYFNSYFKIIKFLHNI